MQRITIRQARPGMVVDHTIVDPRDGVAVLMERGRKLDVEAIKRLHEAGVFDLWASWSGLEQLESFSSLNVSGIGQRLADALRQGFMTVATLLGNRGQNTWEEFANILAHSVYQDAERCLTHKDCVVPSESILRHGAEVATLSMVLAKHLDEYLAQERRASAQQQGGDLTRLALAGVLHDLGELQLDENLRESQKDLLEQNLMDAGWEVHPTLAYEMIRRLVDPVAASIVLNHHRHFDGSGFAGLQAGRIQPVLSGKRLHVFWRLTMAVDTLMHLRQRQGAPMPMVYSLFQIQQAPLVGWFDPVILQGMLDLIPAFPEGTLVQLSDGRVGIVSQHDPRMPCCPVVRLLSEADLHTMFVGDETGKMEETVDLRETGNCWVHRVDGVDVSEYLYGPRPQRKDTTTPSHFSLAVAV